MVCGMGVLKWVLAATLLACPVAAQESYWQYGDWAVQVTAFDTGEDLRVECSAHTGGDGMPSLRLSISNGDAGPPEHYPQLTLHETAPRGHNTQMQNGQAVVMIVDQSLAYYALVDGYFDEYGILNATAELRWQDAIYALIGMQAGQHMDVRLLQPDRASTRITLASLNGFTASYGKMMDSCGHSLELVEPALD